VLKGVWRGFDIEYSLITTASGRIPSLIEEFSQVRKKIHKFEHPNILRALAYVEEPNELGMCFLLNIHMKDFFDCYQEFDDNERWSFASQVCETFVHLCSISRLGYDCPYKLYTAELRCTRNPLCIQFYSPDVLSRNIVGLSTNGDREHTVGCKFLAPEFFSPEDKDDPELKSDVYTFGGLLITLFSRQFPWTDKGYYEVMDLIRGGQKPPELDMIQDTYIHHLASRCLDCNPSRRPDWTSIQRELQNGDIRTMPFPPLGPPVQEVKMEAKAMNAGVEAKVKARAKPLYWSTSTPSLLPSSSSSEYFMFPYLVSCLKSFTQSHRLSLCETFHRGGSSIFQSCPICLLPLVKVKKCEVTELKESAFQRDLQQIGKWRGRDILYRLVATRGSVVDNANHFFTMIQKIALFAHPNILRAVGFVDQEDEIGVIFERMFDTHLLNCFTDFSDHEAWTCALQVCETYMYIQSVCRITKNDCPYHLYNMEIACQRNPFQIQIYSSYTLLEEIRRSTIPNSPYISKFKCLDQTEDSDDEKEENYHSIYAFGGLLIALFAKQLPWTGKSPEKIKQYLSAGGTPPELAMIKHRRVQDLARKCLGTQQQQPDWSVILQALHLQNL